ncbi:unnamed protein product, partial [Staurois parvus]
MSLLPLLVHSLSLCHVPLSGLLTHCWCVEFFDIGCWQITGPYSCCQAPNLPWAPIYRLLMLLPVQSLSWVPVRPPIAAAVYRHTLPCATFRSPHTHCWCPESVMGPCTASHCCCLHRHTLPCATFRSPH